MTDKVFIRLSKMSRSLIATLAALALAVCLSLPCNSSVAFAAPQDNQTTASSRTKIHFLTFGGYNSTDAIIIESNGKFGMIDAGEDTDYPSGKDSRYPWRSGITTSFGIESQVVNYMRKLGINSDNFEFFVGTHPHSDHIGGADTVINTFKPQRVYTPEYDDSYISDKNRLWDNRYVYDQLLGAVEKSGSILIQNLDPNAPIVPGKATNKPSEDFEKETLSNAPSVQLLSKEEIIEQFDVDPTSSDNPYNSEILPNGTITVSNAKDPNAQTYTSDPATTGNPCFTLGEANIEIVNFSDDYKRPNGATDANEFAWGVKVVANGSSAFLSSDICNYDGDETRLAGPVEEGGLGHVDLFKLGHHGYSGSNTLEYLEALSPSTIVQTGYFSIMPEETVKNITSIGARHYDTYQAYLSNKEAIIATFSNGSISLNVSSDKPIYQRKETAPIMSVYIDGLPAPQNEGWQSINGNWYWFEEGSATASDSCFVTENGKTYYIDKYGYLKNGWVQNEGTWYYITSSDVLKTGWLNSGKSWYWLDPDNNGAMATGWFKDSSGTTYYANSKGIMQTGWVQDDGTWFYLNSSGSLKTGWLNSGGSWYWLDPDNNGAMATGWFKDSSGKTYYAAKSGAMATGWIQDKGLWYYLNGSGTLKTGWFSSGNSWYWLDPDNNGAMATDAWVDNDSSYVDSNGKWVPNKPKPIKSQAEESIPSSSQENAGSIPDKTDYKSQE